MGKSSGSTVTNEYKPPGYTVEGWKNYIANAEKLAGNPLSPYGGQTVADLNPQTLQALDMFSRYATQGTPERTAGGQAIVKAAQGEMNPYAAQANPYIGENPYLSKMIDTSNAKIADMYKHGVAAQTDAASARSGAFGGSAYSDAVSQNEQNLLGALAANSNNLLGQNYNQSAQLAESGLNRGMQGWQAGVGNSLQAAQVGLGQQGMDQSAIEGYLRSSQIPQQYQQQLLNAAQNYYQQNQQMPFTLSDYLGNALSRSSGGMGTSTQVGGEQSGLLGGLGGAALIAALVGGG